MRGTEVSEFIDLAYIWQERATEAEAEVERLREVILENESFFTKIMPQVLAVESENTKLKTENALLRKVVEAARGVFLGEGEHLCSEFEDAMDRLEQSLAELDGKDINVPSRGPGSNKKEEGEK